MKSDFLIALTQLAAERHLPREQVLQAIEVALASAFKKDNPASGQNISVKLNPNSGEVRVYALKTVVESVEDRDREISVADAQEIKQGAELGDEVAADEALPHNASRIAAQTAKQVVLQRLREAERELLYQEFLKHEGDIVSGVIEQTEPGRSIALDLGRAQAILPFEEQVPTERYRKGQRAKVYVLSVRNTAKGPEILVSRSHKNMLRRLFEIEVPEVYNGVVEIKAIAREAGYRSKVAVSATQQGIDPVGSCIGVRGNRIQSIVNELQGEKIDIVSWNQDPKVFIAKALSPSEVIEVELSPSDATAMVVVPDRQLSLAIGKEGQNTRLAAKLTGWRLDIKGMTEWEEIREARRRQAAKVASKTELEESEESEPVAELAADSVEVNGTATAVAQAELLEEAVAEVTVTDETTADVAAAETVETIEAGVAQLDEDAILEGLIREEEKADEAKAEQEQEATVSFSVEDLESFTLGDVAASDDDDDEDEDEEPEDGVLLGDMPEIPVLTPDAGKIRFAEDIIEEGRGAGGRNRRRRSGGANRARGPQRGRR
ncbi:MAG: transcription termination/antitermination protein NusA [Chloroflexi bacterium]|nr:transcription termination/antitermination protein NusA [Chloroflexota bacterium]